MQKGPGTYPGPIVSVLPRACGKLHVLQAKSTFQRENYPLGMLVIRSVWVLQGSMVLHIGDTAVLVVNNDLPIESLTVCGFH